MAFAPPSPPTYEIREEGKVLSLFITDPYNSSDPHLRRFEPHVPCYVLRDIKTRKGNTLAAFYLEVPNAEQAILFSHGNAVSRQIYTRFLFSISFIGCERRWALARPPSWGCSNR